MSKIIIPYFESRIKAINKKILVIFNPVFNPIEKNFLASWFLLFCYIFFVPKKLILNILINLFFYEEMFTCPFVIGL